MAALTPATHPPAAARGDKRDAILGAALELFCEHTFDGTPVPLIAERAGVGAGTIYRYFDSKEALANAVYRHWKRELQRALVDDAPRGVPARDEFSHWWRALWRFAAEHPREFAFLETHHHAPYLDAESLQAGAGIMDGARALVRRGQREGSVRRVDADMLIAMVFGAFTGLVKSAGDRGVAASKKAIEDTEACVWAMLRA
jgi:TetR/AcrR family transcriptional regulator, repressor of fatR-cypB operon